MHWNDDHDLFALMRRELFSAVLGDVLDTLGLTHQFLPPSIQPLRSDMVVVGRAMPVLEADYPIFNGEDGQTELSNKPFGLMMEALDDLKPHEIYVASGGSPQYALWGELMSVRAMHLGGAGAILNGYSRDTRGICKINFPTFSRGGFAQDQRVRGKVIDFRTPLLIEGTRVSPGDIVFGDLDGVVVVPRAAERETIMAALEKVRAENLVRTALEGGMPSAEAFATYGVL